MWPFTETKGEVQRRETSLASRHTAERLAMLKDRCGSSLQDYRHDLGKSSPHMLPDIISALLETVDAIERRVAELEGRK